jgi:hypothetical protein
MSLDLDALKAVAEAANGNDGVSRPWTWRGGYPQSIFRDGDAVLVADCFEGPDHPSVFAEFIATFDPPTVLALIAAAAGQEGASRG